MEDKNNGNGGNTDGGNSNGNTDREDRNMHGTKNGSESRDERCVQMEKGRGDQENDAGRNAESRENRNGGGAGRPGREKPLDESLLECFARRELAGLLSDLNRLLAAERNSFFCSVMEFVKAELENILYEILRTVAVSMVEGRDIPHGLRQVMKNSGEILLANLPALMHMTFASAAREAFLNALVRHCGCSAKTGLEKEPGADCQQPDRPECGRADRPACGKADMPDCEMTGQPGCGQTEPGPDGAVEAVYGHSGEVSASREAFTPESAKDAYRANAGDLAAMAREGADPCAGDADAGAARAMSYEQAVANGRRFMAGQPAKYCRPDASLLDFVIRNFKTGSTH